MTRHVSKLLLLLILSVMALSAYATVSEYTFASTAGTFTEITGGTIHGTNANDNECFLAIPIGFSFIYNGVAYNNVSIAANGFLAMGDVVATSNVAISAATGTNNVVAALNRDIKSRDTGTLMTLSSGSAPFRVFTVQWLHYRRVPTTTANDDFSFQIQLLEDGNKVKFVYGPFTAITAPTAAAIQVGLRGDSNADFNNRTTTTDWSATSAGTANNATCTLSATVFPANGLTYTFTPVTQGEVPQPAQNPSPANNALNVAIAHNLSWTAGGGVTDGYKVYLGTDNPPTNIVNGTTQTATTYDPADFAFNTQYFWKIVPFNQYGDALNCPVWSFTTHPDPTVTTYPYLQNFDSVTPPNLPVGWTTINANNDAYTWESYAGNPESTPNSMRVRYNTSLAMDDWLVSPPLQLTQNMFYKVKFYYRANSATYSEALSVMWGNAPTAAGMTTQLFQNLNINNVTYTMVEAIIQPTTTGVYYVGFHGQSPANQFYLFMDTFSVSLVSDSMNPPTNLTATVAGNDVHLAWNAPATRDLLGYKVYRNNAMIANVTGAGTLVYDDMDLAPATYAYHVSAVYTAGESVPTADVSATVAQLDPPTNLTATVQNGNNVHLTWQAPGGTQPEAFTDGFETYADFATTFAPWTNVDVDASATYTMTGTTWPGSASPMAFMVFNPAATTPAITTFTAHTGAKMAVAIASTTPPNNDWMISPQIMINAGDEVSFWARSLTAQYGLERFKVGISTTNTTPSSFTIISGASYIQAPITWTEYSYSLSAYAGQNVYIGIQCVSNDAWFFMVDDFYVGAPTARGEFPYVAVSDNAPAKTIGTPTPGIQSPLEPTRELTGFKVYRDATLIHTITSATTVSYDDLALPVGNYSYTVTAVYSDGESAPAGPATVTILQLNPPTNLTADVVGNDVTLNWVSPEAPPAGTWLTWSQDVLGNSVGTNSAANFDVAHRWPVADLTQYVGSSITQVKFVPAEAACTYTIKVWRGGSATNAGTLVTSQLVANPTIDDWNTVTLNTPVTINANQELWIGYNCNATAGYPAGCDNGPQIDGKGNMIYFNNAWSELDALSATLTYNWTIKGFAAAPGAAKAVELAPLADNTNYSRNLDNASLAVMHKNVTRTERTIAGFKVYRDGVLQSTITDPLITTYSDMDLPNATYLYGVSAVYNNGESQPTTLSVTVNQQLAPAFFTDDFESYPDFSLTFAPWTLLDVDQSATYGIDGVTFANSESPMAYMIFNPSATVPPITSVAPHAGAKMAASFASTTPPNNDWMVTNRVHLGTNSAIRFYARSHTAQYGLERFRVGVSTLPSIVPQGFQYISGTNYLEAPTTWTEYLYDLAAYDNQNVYIGIRCVSNDAFIFYVDDFTIHSNGGSGTDDPFTPVAATELKGNYPNPFNPETTISYSVKEMTPVNIEIYNLKGQKVKTLLSETKAAGNYNVVWNGTDNNNRPVSSGVYFFKMNAGKYSSTKKMIMMK